MGGFREVSKSAAVVVAARKLSQRNERQARRECLADGPQAVEYGLRAQLVKRIFVTSAAATRLSGLVDSAQRDGVEVLLVDDATLAGLSETKTPQGILGVADLPATIANPWHDGLRHVVALEAVQDPGNVGVVLRTADAAGVDLVVLGPGCADPYGAKAIRASAGSAFGVDVAQVDSVEAAVAVAGTHHLRVRATTAVGELELFSVNSPDLSIPTMWLFGNEASGLSVTAMAGADELVRIPMRGGAESLNLGVSAGICMYMTAAAQRTLGGSL